jgi:hypothetical protein
VSARKLIIGFAAAALSTALLLHAQAPTQNPILQAMKDELSRDIKINLPNIEAPYFIQYILDDEEHFNVTATLGGVVVKGREHLRIPQIQVRVGDYKFDNSNFGGAFSGGARYDLGHFPVEDSYPVIRRFFWLETDSAYKGALAALSRKKAALRNITQSENIDDFSPAKPVQSVHPFPKLSLDEDVWTNRIRALSAIFEQYPDVKSSTVELETSAGGFYLVNSEGSEVQSPELVTSVRIRASGQADDGMSIRDYTSIVSLDLNRMPSDVETTTRIKAIADHVSKLTHAPKGEEYSGPVLFEGEAGPQVFAEVLGRNLTVTRRPVASGGRGGTAEPGELEGRVGARVLPDYFTVVDDPTQKEWRGRPLFGTYDVDREGVVPAPLTLVDKGILKNYFLTRQPVRGYAQSNGRARLPGANGAGAPAMSNFFVSASETVPAAELKKKLIELIQTRNKPYGIIIRKMDFPSSASIDEARRIMSAGQGSHAVSPPLLAYKVFPDGHEELVRGLRFRGFSARSLKDILAAGDDSATFEYMDNGAPFSLIGLGSYQVETCVVAPSILIDDLELRPAEEELPKLPIVPAPDSTSGGH